MQSIPKIKNTVINSHDNNRGKEKFMLKNKFTNILGIIIPKNPITTNKLPRISNIIFLCRIRFAY